MNYHISHRDTCRLCDSTDIELVVKLEPIPPQEMYFDNAKQARNVERFPVDVYMCKSCGHVQQLDILNAEALWDDYTYHSADAKGMVEHFQEVAAGIVNTYNPPVNSLVIDVGSNDGSLLKPFKEKGFRVLGIDPAKEIAEKATASGIFTIPELFTEKLAQEIKDKNGLASVITAFNSYAHADQLEDLTLGIKKLLKDDGIFVFEVQYLLDVLQKMLIGTIFHEHMSHHSLTPLKLFLERIGFTIISVSRSHIQHGSLIGIAQKTDYAKKSDKSVEDLLALEKKENLCQISSMEAFNDRLKMIKKEVEILISEWKKNEFSIAGYGAARSGQTLISQLGFEGVIEYILDDNPDKVYKYPAGDGIQVLPTIELYKRNPDFVIILAWVHSERIIAEHQNFLQNGGHFVVISPDIKVI